MTTSFKSLTTRLTLLTALALLGGCSTEEESPPPQGNSGGGGSVPPTAGNYPFVCNNVANSLEGCWAAACASAQIKSIRFFNTVDSQGDLGVYAIRFNTGNCTGEIDKVFQFSTGLQKTVTSGPVDTCTNAATGDPVSCRRLDVTHKLRRSNLPEETGYTVYALSGNRLCFAPGDFGNENQDETGVRMFTLPNATDPTQRPTEIDFSACMTRFSP